MGRRPRRRAARFGSVLGTGPPARRLFAGPFARPGACGALGFKGGAPVRAQSAAMRSGSERVLVHPQS